MARFRKKFSTLRSLLNWLHHPLLLESDEFFVSRSIFSRLYRVLNVSEGAEFSSPYVYQLITGLLTKSFGQRVRNVCETVFLTLVQEGAENAQGERCQWPNPGSQSAYRMTGSSSSKNKCTCLLLCK